MGYGYPADSYFMGVAEDYIKYLSAKNLAQGTILNRLYVLKVFADFLNGREPSYDLILDFIEHKKGSWKGETLYKSVWILKNFFRWAFEHAHYRQDFGNRVPYPKFSFSQRKIPSWDDAIKVIEYRRERSITKVARTYDLIFNLLIRTGMRPSECLKLKVENLDWNAGVISILETKTGDFRIVPIPQDINNELKRYIKGKKQEDHIFINKWGNPFQSCDLSQELYARKKEMDLDIPLSGYTLRHLFATEMRRQGCPRSVLQQLLGHRRADTTAIYDHYVHEDLKDALVTFHPLVSRGVSPRRRIEMLKEKVRSLKLETDKRIRIKIEQGKRYYRLDVEY